ncbi:hypothetical protein B0H19DRAFT_1249290 [Mycena capillaripes]|nr:hypothetical protein B0H19DRAFT_1249290 [Mycena capillaripes]
MDKLTCILPHPSCTTIFPFLAQIRRLETFVSRLTSIKEVCLDLDSTHGVRCLSIGTDKDLQAWSSHFGGLLSCIIQRGCKTLTIVAGTYLINAYELDDAGGRTKHLRQVIRRLFVPPAATALGFKRNPAQGKAHHRVAFPSLLSDTAQLTSLNINSATLIVPPGLEWTLAALRHSPINALSIAMSRVPARIWRVVLPLIASAAPNITTLSLTHLDVDGESDIISFLFQLPRLAHLHLTHHQLWGPRGHRVKGVTLPLRHLITLRAPPNLVEHFLSRAECCPGIESICVLWAHLNLTLFVRFMSSILHKLRLHRLAPRLSVWTESMSSNTEPDIVVGGLGLTAAQIDAFRCVEHLDMEETYPSSAHAQNIGHLLALFPGVKHLSLNIRKEFSETSAMQLAQNVRATEFLTTMEVNGRSYDLSSGSHT